MYASRQILKCALCFLCSVLLFACRGEEVIYPTLGTRVTDEVRQGGLYVLCEGNMGSNKARLDYINLETGTYYSNWYGGRNPHQMKELGDVGNDIQRYGGRLYAVINCSHKVEVMDASARHVGQVDIPNCRNMAFAGNKMYVSAYVGSSVDADLSGAVYEVDTATLAVTREVQVGHQPDELCIVGNRLYVCNSGGYLTNRYDSTLSVIDLGSFTEIERLPVGINPTRVGADAHGRLWVCCQGYWGKTDADRMSSLVIIENTSVIKRIDVQASAISIVGSIAYIIDYNARRLRAFSTLDLTEQEQHIDISKMENPYALLATTDALYVTDAKNYVSSGMLYCYDYDGHLRWQAKTGDIPGHLCRVAEAYSLYDTLSSVPHSPSPYIKTVYEYVPAPGQFVHELPKYAVGDDAAMMCRKCEQAIANNANGLVSLGGWGGYITFGFDHAVRNSDGRDIQILGNAFYQTGSTIYGSSEPGIVLVSCDANGNNLPDDEWYELKGCLYDNPSVAHAQTKTYTRVADTIRNPFHQHAYYPLWMPEQLTFIGSVLPSQTEHLNTQYVQRILDYGYVDNRPNTDVTGTSFDISWAVDATGQNVSLDSIHFVRVYTAVDETFEQTGELSTEISGAIDLHLLNNYNNN